METELITAKQALTETMFPEPQKAPALLEVISALIRREANKHQNKLIYIGTISDQDKNKLIEAGYTVNIYPGVMAYGNHLAYLYTIKW